MEQEGAPERHVVLVTPEVHWNTGNVGRTCLGTGAHLHLIKPLGFSLDSAQVKRAGLDYWEHVALSVWDNLDAFYGAMAPEDDEVALFAKLGSRPFWEMPKARRLFLFFGSETKGLPASVLNRYPASRYHIPINREIRCLNLSTSVGIALYESLRGAGVSHGWGGDGD
ncbi:tRNA (cytidine(34)-2'-O)-methyltransferase [Desulfoluna spongiiphila]|uniref:Putative tRNA (cytidine(34)-2'-O)-methyltransferase n=1 Tax=Desulfoluna spongiiphila TaxID=419481 RepID=A0A1G5JE99_9BACT|nr:tRNA (cytidine(34)-2'-O)-methyltransferase [Desulfoluna spongiiphila]SCY86577.1 tRNA (cytidine/uridine-2'-O-)-methyltransferase [Desulfoluna spongiiphila]VVS93090.1 trna (cytidine/uridine-2'-o-)-methyltransferase [Desulfoluna spongiiphila]